MVNSTQREFISYFGTWAEYNPSALFTNFNDRIYVTITKTKTFVS